MTSPLNTAQFTIQHWPVAVQALNPTTAVVLGSGLGGMVDQMEVAAEVPYQDIKDHPVSNVPGHAGKYVFGHIGGECVALALGRVHLYEGYSAATVCGGIRALAALGIKKLVLTNAAGTSNPDFHPGDWMMLSDQINFSGQTPLMGGPHFHDMSRVYSPRLREVFRAHAEKLGMLLNEGVYLSVLGPQYETPAEVRAYRSLGADAIGMSTVNEAIQARALGMEVAGFSCLTNWAAGMGQETLHHQEVVETGKIASGRLLELLKIALPDISKAG